MEGNKKYVVLDQKERCAKLRELDNLLGLRSEEVDARVCRELWPTKSDEKTISIRERGDYVSLDEFNLQLEFDKELRKGSAVNRLLNKARIEARNSYAARAPPKCSYEEPSSNRGGRARHHQGGKWKPGWKHNIRGTLDASGKDEQTTTSSSSYSHEPLESETENEMECLSPSGSDLSWESMSETDCSYVETKFPDGLNRDDIFWFKEDSEDSMECLTDSALTIESTEETDTENTRNSMCLSDVHDNEGEFSRYSMEPKTLFQSLSSQTDAHNIPESAPFFTETSLFSTEFMPEDALLSNHEDIAQVPLDSGASILNLSRDLLDNENTIVGISEVERTVKESMEIDSIKDLPPIQRQFTDLPADMELD